MFLGISLNLCSCLRALTGGAPPAVLAPVLTRTSSAGAAPLTMDATNGVAGYTLHLQIDNTAGGLFPSPEQDILHTLTESEAASGDIDLSGEMATPSGYYEARCRWERDDGANSAWSNTITDTIVSSVAKLTSTAGTSRHANLTWPAVAGSHELDLKNADWGATYKSRATISGTGKKHFEMTFVGWDPGGSASLFVIGLDDGSYDFNGAAATAFPGNSGTANGISLRFDEGGGSTSGTVYKGGSFTGAGANSDLLAGDIIIVEFDTAADTVDFYRRRSGSTVQIGATHTGQSWSNTMYAFGGCNRVDSGTFNFGATAFASAPNSGYVFYG